MEALFKRWDVDGGGTISREELREAEDWLEKKEILHASALLDAETWLLENVADEENMTLDEFRAFLEHIDVSAYHLLVLTKTNIVLSGMLVLYVLCGTILFALIIEDRHVVGVGGALLNSLYFIVITMTTVGLGDKTIPTNQTKPDWVRAVSTTYFAVGLGLTANFLSLLSRTSSKRGSRIFEIAFAYCCCLPRRRRARKKEQDAIIGASVTMKPMRGPQGMLPDPPVHSGDADAAMSDRRSSRSASRVASRSSTSELVSDAKLTAQAKRSTIVLAVT